ncbi:MAG: hypothetical protein AABX50_02330 [Nanoarchaeota archaeon]
MKGKRGSIGTWALIILLVFVVGALVLFISSRMFYTKTEVKDLVNDSVSKASCEYVSFDDASYFGKTPTQICNDMDKEPEFLFITESVQVISADGFNTYNDQNYLVDRYSFKIPLGMAVDSERSYGNPSFGYKGEVNRYTQGLLCCG